MSVATTADSTSEKVQEALAYLDAMRRTGQGLGADVLDAAITALIADNLKTYSRARLDTLQSVRSRVEGLTAVGTGALKMQFAVLDQLTLMEGPA